MRIIEKIEEGNVYHIFNRGINGENIFLERRNYHYFLQQYQKYCARFLETYAYVLLKNHFHLLVKVKPLINESSWDGTYMIRRDATKQLSHFFNSYAQSINKAYQRHGKLFEEPFKRKEVKTDSYFTGLIYYLHLNAQHHGLVSDFRNWEFSSYHSILSHKEEMIVSNEVIDWFGSKENYIKAHMQQMDFTTIADFVIE